MRRPASPRQIFIPAFTVSRIRAAAATASNILGISMNS